MEKPAVDGQRGFLFPGLEKRKPRRPNTALQGVFTFNRLYALPHPAITNGP